MITMSIRKLLCIYVLLIGLLISGYKNVKLENSAELPFSMFDNQEDTVNKLVNKEGLTSKIDICKIPDKAEKVFDCEHTS